MAELTVPRVDFSPLGELGEIYKKGQNERGVSDAFSQGIGSDPQSLAALAQRVAPYNPQLAVNLAQLSHSYTRQSAQDARQAGLDDFNRNMQAESLRLRQNADKRAATEAEQPSELERRAEAGGLAKGTPEYQQFILRGGRNADVAPSAGEKKEIFKAEDELPNIDGTIDVLKMAKDLNSKTFTGVTAGARGMLGTSGIPGANLLVDKGSAMATREFGQLMSGEAVKTMAETLKGATTDFEFKKFEAMMADPSTPPEIRGRMIERMLKLAEKHKETKTRRINELGGGTYFKRPAGQPATTGPTGPTREIPPAAIEALRANPDLRDQFEAKYGKGVAAVVLR